MRAGVSSLVLVWLLGCSGQNVVGGDDKTKAEQLEASLPAWCQKACSMLAACGEASGCDCSGDPCDCPSVEQDCPDDCQQELSRFARSGDTCAEVGERFKQCIDDNGCDVTTVSGLCELTDAERAACPEIDDGVDQPPMSTGPVVGTAGSAGTSPPSGGPNYPGVAVTCMGAYGAGGGMPSGVPSGSSVTCEEGRDTCSDGHDYSWICVVSSQGEAACSCLLDEQVVGAFDPGVGCPALTEVNAGCGWNLAD